MFSQRSEIYGIQNLKSKMGFILTVTGFEAIPGAEGVDSDDGLLFASFEVFVDLPHEDTTHDIAVPASAAAR